MSLVNSTASFAQSSFIVKENTLKQTFSLHDYDIKMYVASTIYDTKKSCALQNYHTEPNDTDRKELQNKIHE